MIKDNLEITDTKGNMALLGNPNLKSYNQSTVKKRIQDTRTKLMLSLKDCTITLAEYMLSFGSSIDCKDTNCIMDDLEDEIEKDEELAKPQATKVTPGCHSKVSNKKYQNVSGKLSSKVAEEQEEEVISKTPMPETPKTKRAKKKLSMEL